jgi:hypothetical protein
VTPTTQLDPAVAAEYGLLGLTLFLEVVMVGLIGTPRRSALCARLYVLPAALDGRGDIFIDRDVLGILLLIL